LEKLEDLNITEFHRLAWRILTANKRLTLLCSFIFLVFSLALIIPIINIVVSFFFTLIAISTIKFFFDFVNSDESIDDIVSNIENYSISQVIFSNLNISFGVFLASLIINIGIYITLAFSLSVVMMAGFLLVIWFIVLYSYPLYFAVALIQREFYYSFKMIIFCLFAPKTYSIVFSKDYFLTTLYMTLVLIVLTIISFAFNATLILAPLSAFILLFICAYTGICSFYIYEKFGYKMYEKSVV
jgi:hypothetical protein